MPNTRPLLPLLPRFSSSLLCKSLHQEGAEYLTLFFYTQRGFNKVIELLLARGANLNTRDENGNTYTSYLWL
jgi:ankyrin repeat protein